MMADATNTTQSGSGSGSTQQHTQSTEQASQPESVIDADCWGVLIPCSFVCQKYVLLKSQQTYRIGRSPDKSVVDITLPGVKISTVHCTIEWDGDEGPTSAVKVIDQSRNGTFINGKRIPAGQWKILHDGTEIAFGHRDPQPAQGGAHDYRFIYRHMAYTPPNGGVHKYYDLVHELGKGSFATVMKALHREEGRWYAVKIIQLHKLRDGWQVAFKNGLPTTEGAKMLKREITVLERLNHPNICKLKEVFLQTHSICLVLELVSGGDLMRYLLQRERQGIPMSEPQAQHIIRQICAALAYVHEQGIAHRDLKPENVLLTTDSPPVVKVADFGLAKIVDTLTKLQTTCGTPTYQAPEINEHGPEGYSQVVDSWSVGIIAFIMLTLAMQPYNKYGSKGGTKAKDHKRRVNWKLLRDQNLSKQCENFIRKLLEYDPERRMTLIQACDHPWLAAPAEAAPDEKHSNSSSPAESHSPDALTPPALLVSETTVPDTGTVVPACRRERTEKPKTEEEPPHPPQQESPLTDVEGEEPPPAVEAPRGQKRKAMLRSDTSLIPSGESESSQNSQAADSPAAPPHTDAPEAAQPACGGKKGKKRSRQVKRQRTVAVAPEDADGVEVPGLVRRRSPRLNPPA